SSGYSSIIEWTPLSALNSRLSCESLAVPEYQPATELRFVMSEKTLNSFLCSSLLSLIMNITCHACFVSSDRALVRRLTIFFTPAHKCPIQRQSSSVSHWHDASPMMRRRRGSALLLLPKARQPG